MFQNKYRFCKTIALTIIFVFTFGNFPAYADGPMCASSPFWATVSRLDNQATNNDAQLAERIDGMNLILANMWPDLVAEAQTNPALNSLLYRMSNQGALTHEIMIDENTYQNLGYEPFGPDNPSSLTYKNITMNDMKDNAGLLLLAKPEHFEDLELTQGAYALNNMYKSIFDGLPFDLIPDAYASSSPWMPNGIGFLAGGEGMNTFAITRFVYLGFAAGGGAEVQADFMEDQTGEWNLNLGVNMFMKANLWPKPDSYESQLRTNYGLSYYTSMPTEPFDIFTCKNGARYPYNNITFWANVWNFTNKKRVLVGVSLYPNWEPQDAGNNYYYDRPIPSVTLTFLLDEIVFYSMENANGMTNAMGTEPTVDKSTFDAMQRALPSYREAELGRPATPRLPSQTNFMTNLLSTSARNALGLSPCIRFVGMYSTDQLGQIRFEDMLPGSRFTVAYNSRGTFFNGADTNGLSMDNIILGISAATGAAGVIGGAYAGKSPEIAFWTGMGTFLVPMAPAVVQAAYCASGVTKAFSHFGNMVSKKCVDKNMQFSSAEEYTALANVVDAKLKTIAAKAQSSWNSTEQNIMSGLDKIKNNISGAANVINGWYPHP